MWNVPGGPNRGRTDPAGRGLLDLSPTLHSNSPFAVLNLAKTLHSEIWKVVRNVIMSAHVVALGVNGSRRNGSEEGTSQQSDMTLPLRRVRPWMRRGNPMGDSSNVESLVRPALPGRKMHRSWVREETRGRRQMESQTEGRLEGREANTDSGSSSNSEVQLSNMAYLAEGSNNTQRGSSRYNNGRWSHGTEGNLQSPHARSVIPRTHISESQTVSNSSPEEQDPFWVEVRTGTANASSSQAPTEVRVQTGSELGEEEEEEEEEVEDGGEGGSGVMEVQGQIVNPELLLPTVGVGERRMSRREKNRMRCLRRRQRKKERWRQLQESQQVNHTLMLIHVCLEKVHEFKSNGNF